MLIEMLLDLRLAPKERMSLASSNEHIIWATFNIKLS